MKKTKLFAAYISEITIRIFFLPSLPKYIIALVFYVGFLGAHFPAKNAREISVFD